MCLLSPVQFSNICTGAQEKCEGTINKNMFVLQKLLQKLEEKSEGMNSKKIKRIKWNFHTKQFKPKWHTDTREECAISVVLP